MSKRDNARKLHNYELFKKKKNMNYLRKIWNFET